MKRSANQRGFTLVEILIAVGLLAVSAAGFLGVIGSAYSEQARNEVRLRAALLANNKMTEVLAAMQADADKGVYPDEKEETGAFESPDDAFEWNYAVRKVEIPLKDMINTATGGGLDALMGGEGSEEGASLDATAGTAASQVDQALKNNAGQLDLMSKDVSKAVREVKVNITWKDDESTEEQTLTLVTHFVNMKVL